MGNRVLLQAFPHALNESQRRSLNGDGTSDIDLGKTCRNTKQGRTYMADERGYVCKREHVHQQTGCCPTEGAHAIKRNSCELCDTAKHCCEHFEFCVSCCLRDEHRPRVQQLIAA